MYPVLIKLGGFRIYTYGFFIALGFLIGIGLLKSEAARTGEQRDELLDLAFYLIGASVIGSRLFYVFSAPEMFLKDPLEIFRIWNGGVVFYGAFIAAFVTGCLYLRVKGKDIWRVLDIMIIPVPAGQFIGRLGCFFSGCCYGQICGHPWAFTFSDPDSLAPTGVPLHPTQLYHAAGNLAVFVLLWFLRKHKLFNGQLFWFYVLFYGLTRVFIEFFRGDLRGREVFDFLSLSQSIGVVFSIIAVLYLLVFGLRVQKKNKTGSVFPGGY